MSGVRCLKINPKLTANILADLLLLLMAVLVVVSFVNTASAVTAGMQGDRSITGEVVTVDHGPQAGTLTLRSNQIGQFPNDKLNIFINQNTRVQVCNEKEPVSHMQVDRNATVLYHEAGGVLVADSIHERC